MDQASAPAKASSSKMYMIIGIVVLILIIIFVMMPTTVGGKSAVVTGSYQSGTYTFTVPWTKTKTFKATQKFNVSTSYGAMKGIVGDAAATADGTTFTLKYTPKTAPTTAPAATSTAASTDKITFAML